MFDFFVDCIIPIVLYIFIGFVAIYLVITCFCHLSFPGDMARIERIRIESKYISEQCSEDLVGELIMANVYICQQRKYNKIWWAAIVIPNGWDYVDYIEIPDQFKNKHQTLTK